MLILSLGQITRCCVQNLLHLHGISDFQKLFLTLDPNQVLIPRHPVPREGALAIATDVGAGSGGRRCAFDEQRVTRTAKSCGPDAPMAGVKSLRSSRFLGATVTNKLWSHRGEHEISRKAIAQGRPECFR
jgi:hypothetical protein